MNCVACHVVKVARGKENTKDHVCPQNWYSVSVGIPFRACTYQGSVCVQTKKAIKVVDGVVSRRDVAGRGLYYMMWQKPASREP